MAKMKLIIQHGNNLIEPPVEEGVKIEWERTGSPGKLTFKTIQTDWLVFTEGDPVCFYYDEKPVFKGYVFTKKQDKDRQISVTCYDQIRYLKNKYTYVFENKKANEIILALCKDFKLNTGTFSDTGYVIPAIAEENKSALDIVLSVLEETTLNSGNQFVFYDDFGTLKVTDCANMVSKTLIMEDTAENFEYSSSIDSETYNQIVLYYKQDDQIVQLYTATSPDRVSQWGLLRHFEETDVPTSGQNKANALLNLYNKKTREVSVKGAFGDITVRGGTLIPVRLNLGEGTTNNFMQVDKVTHTFEYDHYTMDLTLLGEWDDGEYEVVSETLGEIPEKTTGSSGTSGSGGSGGFGNKPLNGSKVTIDPDTARLRICFLSPATYDNLFVPGHKRKTCSGEVRVWYKYQGKEYSARMVDTYDITFDKYSKVTIEVRPDTYCDASLSWVSQSKSESEQNLLSKNIKWQDKLVGSEITSDTTATVTTGGFTQIKDELTANATLYVTWIAGKLHRG